MKSPTAQTALLGLIATLVSLTAAWFYPWPESVTQSDFVGKPLFESFEAKDVRTITVVEYDADRNGLKQIVLRRSGEFWVIPARQNFVANNSNQISAAINSVNTNVLEQRANDLQDHVEFGVVDPMEFESTLARNSLGKKIVLQDRNNRELASLIVGGTPRDDANVNQTRRFVRITGKPGVYVVELPHEALTTEFSRWVSPNLFELNDIADVGSITINNYRTEKDQLTVGNPPKIWKYQLEIDVKNQKQTLSIPNSQGELEPLEITAEQANAIRQVGMYLGNIVFSDARKKTKTVAELLKNPRADLANGLSRLNEEGFTAVEKIPNRSFGFKVQSVGGDISLQNPNGVSISLFVGNLVEAQAGESSDLSRLVMLYASFDPAFFPSPTKPVGDDESEQRAYLRQVAERDAKIKEAEGRAQLLNNMYGDWFYVVSEQVISGLIPDLRFDARPTPSPPSPSEEDAKSSETPKPETDDESGEPRDGEKTPDSANDGDGE